MDRERVVAFSDAVAPILETALDAGVLMRADGVVADWNSQAEQTFGWSKAEAVGRPLADLVIPLPLREAHEHGLRRLLATREGDRFARRLEVTALHRSGHELPIELSISAISLEGETLFLGFLRDISERKRAEALHLDVARVLTRRALEAELLFRITRLLTQSETFEEALRASIQAICETVGWPLGHAFVVGESARLASTGIWHPVGPDAFDAFKQASRHVRFAAGEGIAGSVLEESEPVWRSEADWRPDFTRADVAQLAGIRSGCWFPISSGDRRLAVLEFFSDRLTPPDADLLRMVRTVAEHIGRVFERDEAARRLEERAGELRVQAQELRKVQSVAKLGSWRRRLSGEGEWSEEVYALFGYDPAEGTPSFDDFLAAVAPEDRDRVLEALSDTAPDSLSLEFGIVRPDGERRFCWIERHLDRDSSGAVVGLHGICQDVTARANAAAQLRQAQKMETVGQLTGGLAHDFNNLLSIIIGNLDFIEGEMQEGSSAREFSATALEAALKGAELTQQLLAFSRRQPLAPKVIDLNELVGGMTALVSRTIGEAVTIQVKRSDDLWPATADPSQVESAILNLVVNARDAMPSGGVLTIETANHRGEPDEGAGPPPDGAERDYVVVAVSDSGHGMSVDVLAKVFEPFFSTKDVGKGSGLGLSMIYGFAEQSGGHVRIYSEPGHGTTVRLYLPASREEASSAAGIAVQPMLLAGNETVLVVEDNEMVRRIAVRQLQDLGYDVLQADNGPAALETLRANPHVDLLFTDVVMPGGMNGLELAEHARHENPGLRVLYTTGFTEAAIAAPGVLSVSDALISKPYRKAELATRLREVLEAA